VLGGGSYAAYLKGVNFVDVRDLAKALLLENLLTREVEWKTDSFDDDKRFSFASPEGWEVKKDDKEVVMSNGEEEIKVYKAEEIIEEDDRERVLEVVSGEEVVVFNNEEGTSKAYVPVSSSSGKTEYVVVEGSGNTWEQAYKQIDLTPYVPDWKIFGQEEAETLRILEEMDKLVGVLAPVETSGQWKADKAIIVGGSTFSYVGYGDGVRENTILVNTKELVNGMPKVEGYYNFPIKESGGSWVILNNEGKSLAIMPVAKIYLRDGGEWNKKKNF